MFCSSQVESLATVQPNMLESSPSEHNGKRKVGVCKYFASGKHCSFGDRCKWKHSTEDPEHVSKSAAVSHKDISRKRPNKTPSADQNATADTSRPPKVCSFFKKHGRCRFGAGCRYLHSVPEENGQKSLPERKSVEVESDEIMINKSSEGSPEGSSKKRSDINPEAASENRQSTVSTVDGVKDSQNSGPKDKKDGQVSKRQQQRRLCRYFKVGKCTMGDRCRFRHPSEFADLRGDEISRQEATRSDTRRRPAFSLPTKTLSQISDEERKKLRETEVQQLQKRFTQDRIHINEENTPTIYRVVFSPTDPDWPFDVMDFEMEITFPEDYPKEKFDVVFPADQNLPEIVTRHLNKMATERVTEMHTANVKQDKAVLIFRPFLKWLDKNLEEIFTEGARKYKMEVVAKAAGFEFIPAEELRSRQAARQSDEGEGSCGDEGAAEEEGNVAEPAASDEDGETEETALPSKSYEMDGSLSKNERSEARGTEIRLRGLELTGDAATLHCYKVFLSIQCNKCKAKSDVKTTPGRVNSVTCSRCANQQLVAYRSKLMHQYSSVVGYLDLQGCVPFDLIVFDSEFNVGCLECSKEMNFKGLQFGQPKDMWCKHCHKKMKIVAQSVRFMRFEPSEPVVSGKVHVVEVKKGKKVMKDPAIQEGKPLPDFGTCKHYKKSFRWLRFPCCGKTFPCDVCHDAEEDHEFKFANRMLCGHCAKEQPYAADRPCISCDSSMTKSKTAHWEGGQGCRNKTTMSKGDKHKYSSSSKTVSRKQQTKQQPTKKK